VNDHPKWPETNLGSVAAPKHRLRLVRTHAKAQIATSVSSVSRVSPRLPRPKAKGSGTCLFSLGNTQNAKKNLWPMDFLEILSYYRILELLEDL